MAERKGRPEEEQDRGTKSEHGIDRDPKEQATYGTDYRATLEPREWERSLD